MLVDNPMNSQPSFNSVFEDFFNMELLSGGQPSSSSRSSSSSPTTGLSALPQNPSQTSDSFFNFSFEDEFVKPETIPHLPPSFDLFGSLVNINDRFSSSSSQSGSGSSPEEVATPSVFAIDPQLVGTPSATKSQSEADEDEGRLNADIFDIPLSEVAAPYKVGGKGKSNRKGTVQGGGIVKKTPPVKEKVVSSPQSSVEDSNKDLDDWRPSPEEYKKMSSKEKRQLRNKISARNFRVRRKEYITTLETDIAERDRIIDAIRNELGSTKSENTALRQEIDALKKSLLHGQQQTPVLPPPAPLPAVSAAASAAARNTATPSSPLLAPNINKDLPSSPRLASARGGFWGGQGSSPFGAMGGFTPVHTTFVPEWSISATLSGKGLVTPPDSPPLDTRPRALQENINPAMNASSSLVKQPPGSPDLQNMNPFDSFTDANPFTMKTLDMYRMHLWSRLAQQQHQHQSALRQQNQSISQQSSLSGLATELRPHYFAAAAKAPFSPSSTSSSLSGLLSGKSVTGLYPSPPSSPRIVSSAEQSPRPSVQEAALARLASQTLLSKLGSAFWSAFAGQSTSSMRKGLDAEKIRKVLEGKAIVQVVDIDERASSLASKSLSGTKAMPSNPKSNATSLPKSTESRDRCRVNVGDILEESMRSLSISKRGTY